MSLKGMSALSLSNGGQYKKYPLQKGLRDFEHKKSEPTKISSGKSDGLNISGNANSFDNGTSLHK
eukprot:13135209-Ditylum_brightwellii.AAC.1